MSTVYRHSLTVRLTHWTIALSGILLLFSGFGQMPMYKRYNLVKVPGLAWSSNYEITLLLHYIGAAVFTAAAVFHIIYHFKRKEFAIVPRKGDLEASLQGVLAIFGYATEPPHGKFQAKQRVIYLVFFITGSILILTGLVKSYKNLGVIVLDPVFLQWMAFTHTISSMIFMFLFLAHIAALGILYRAMIPSMFSGKIDATYAQHHHPDWHIQS